MPIKAIISLVIGIITLLLFFTTLPWDFEKEAMSDWGYVVILASGIGWALGFSTWRATEKSKLGLAGGILCLAGWLCWIYVAIQSIIHMGW